MKIRFDSISKEVFSPEKGTTHITLFVSSSFKNMHVRRDLLRNRVQPLLNEVANINGYSVSFCDLRWGVNSFGLERDERTYKTLRVCLDAIDESMPPLIALLGKEYGTVGDPNALRKMSQEREISLESYEISYTDFEIKYACQKYGSVLVYEFDEADECKDVHLRELKNQLSIDYPDSIRSVSDDEMFIQTAYRDIKHILTPMLENALPPEELEFLRHWNYFKAKREFFSARENELNYIYDRIKDHSGGLVIKGDSGIGKSSLISELVFRLSEEGWHILPIECGLTDLSSRPIDLIKRIFDYIGLEYDANTTSVKQLIGKYLEECVPVKPGFMIPDNIVVVLDGVNQLFYDPAPLIDLLRITKGFRFIITCTPDVNVKNAFTYDLGPLLNNDIEKVVSGLLDYYHKELETDVVKEMMRKPDITNPLYVSLLLHLLLLQNKDDYEQIQRLSEGEISRVKRDELRIGHQLELIASAPDTIEELIYRLCDSMADNINRDLVFGVLKYIALSRYGLRDSDLQKLLESCWDELDFHTLVNYFHSFFIKRLDGRYDFSHSVIRESVRANIGIASDNNALKRMMSSLPMNDPVKVREYAYHIIQDDDPELLYELIIGNMDNKSFIRNIAENIHYVSVYDDGKWIIGFIKRYSGMITDSNDAVLRFVVDDLMPLFSITNKETSIQLSILTSISDRFSRPDNTNISVLNKLIRVYTEAGVCATRLNDYRTSAVYGMALFDCYQKLGGPEKIDLTERFRMYYNPLVLLKSAMDDCSHVIQEAFFKIADAGISSGAYMSNGSLPAGQFMGCIGEACDRLGRYAEMAEYYNRDLELRKNGYKNNPTDQNTLGLAGGYGNVGMAFFRCREYQKSIDNYEEAIRLYESVSLDGMKDADIAEQSAYKSDAYHNCCEAALRITSGLTESEINKFVRYKMNEVDCLSVIKRLKGEPVDSNAMSYEIEKYKQNIARKIIVDPVKQTVKRDPIQKIDKNVIIKDGWLYCGQIDSSGNRDGIGYAVLINNEQVFYKGMWKDDKHCGYGESHVYAGEWKDGNIHGYGIRTGSDEVTAGIWENNTLVKKLFRHKVSKYLNKLRKSIDMDKLDFYEGKAKTLIKRYK